MDKALAMLGGWGGVNPTGDVVQAGGMTADTVEILTVHPHVNIKGLVRLHQG